MSQNDDRCLQNYFITKWFIFFQFLPSMLNFFKFIFSSSLFIAGFTTYNLLRVFSSFELTHFPAPVFVIRYGYKLGRRGFELCILLYITFHNSLALRWMGSDSGC